MNAGIRRGLGAPVLWLMMAAALGVGCDGGSQAPAEAPKTPATEKPAQKPAAKPVEEPVAQGTVDGATEKPADKEGGAAEGDDPQAQGDLAPDEASNADDTDAGQAPSGGEVGDLKLLEAVVARGVEERMPRDVGDTFDTSVGTLWGYVSIRNDGDPTGLKMSWQRDGAERFAIDVKVGSGKAWRTWSRKNIGKKDVGKWVIELQTADGAVLGTIPFEIVAAP